MPRLHGDVGGPWCAAQQSCSWSRCRRQSWEATPCRFGSRTIRRWTIGWIIVFQAFTPSLGCRHGYDVVALDPLPGETEMASGHLRDALAVLLSEGHAGPVRAEIGASWDRSGSSGLQPDHFNVK